LPLFSKHVDRLRVPAIQRLTLLCMAVALAMLGLGGAILLDLRADAWRQAEQASYNLALALSRDISRNIHMFDLSLQGVITTLEQPGIDQLVPEMRQMMLFNRAASTEYMGSMLVLGLDGRVLASTQSLHPDPVSMADREQFLVHQQNPDVGLFISRPYQSRLTGGAWSIAISRRLNRPDGSFGGVVTGGLRLAYFRDLVGKLELGSQGRFTLFRSDGRVIIHLPGNNNGVDWDLSVNPLFRRFAATSAGNLSARSELDGIERLYTFRHLGGLPLLVTIGVADVDIYAAWRRKAIGIGSILAVLCGATMGLCILFRREIQRRMAAEVALQAAADQLSVAATTDGLTGLANRRAFDQALSKEWLRAIRGQQPIALLMLDADCFKLFNDRYGHLPGDDVLRGIAGCIVQSLRRPADTGARFGGEEFVALLPETEQPGAYIVAEKIRDAVAALNIPHDGSVHARVTISVGVAVLSPAVGDLAETLIAQADAALYAAKRAGRNRVCTALHDETRPIVWTAAPQVTA